MEGDMSSKQGQQMRLCIVGPYTRTAEQLLTIGHDQTDVVHHLPVTKRLFSSTLHNTFLDLALILIINVRILRVVVMFQVVSHKPLGF